MDVITMRLVLKDLALPVWVYKVAKELGLTGPKDGRATLRILDCIVVYGLCLTILP